MLQLGAVVTEEREDMLTLLAKTQGFLWLVGCIAVIGFGFWMVAMLFPKRTTVEPDQFDPHSKPGGEVRRKYSAAPRMLGYALNRTENDGQKHKKQGEKQ